MGASGRGRGGVSECAPMRQRSLGLGMGLASRRPSGAGRRKHGSSAGQLPHKRRLLSFSPIL